MGLAAGSVTGAGLNAIGSAACFEYWSIVMHTPWSGITFPITRGALEGGIAGTLLGAVLSAIHLAQFPNARIAVSQIVSRLVQAALLVGIGWVITGLLAAAMNTAASNVYQSLFPMTRFSSSPTAFAFVGGAIWGAYGAALFAAVFTAIRFWGDLDEGRSTKRGFEVLSEHSQRSHT